MTTLTNTDELTLKVAHLQEGMDRLENKLDRNSRVMDAYAKKKGLVDAEDDEEGDENKERGNWSGKLDFLLSCLGYAVGLGNVWRFPFLAYDNGGGAFFIPYCIMLGIVGIPIFFMELSLGQFSSSGPTKCWGFAPLFQGVGYGMMVVSLLVAIYYNMIIAWAFYYLFASFTDSLPWADCGNSWNDALCSKGISDRKNLTSDCKEWKNGSVINTFTFSNKGYCMDNNTIIGIYNGSLAKEHNVKYKLPSDQYFFGEVLGKTAGKGLEDFGGIQDKLVLSLILAWVFIGLTLSKGVKSSGKVVYVTATFPYIVLIILLVRGVTLDGYLDGIDFYITPDTSKLTNAKVWKDAAVQIFFSLSASWGGLIALSSYNRFHNDCFRDSLVVAFGNCLTSLFAGFVVFSFLGFLSKETGLPVEDVATGGPGLTFIVYPAAVTQLPASPVWAVLFFLMLVTLGVDSEFVLVETVLTSIYDMFPGARDFKAFTVGATCLVLGLLGLPLCLQGGEDLLTLMDTYSGGWNVLVIAICECVAIAWVYGARRFLSDIESMLGTRVCRCLPWAVWKPWWTLCWAFLTPAGVAFILVFSWIDYTRIESFPRWADALGWGMTLTVIVCIFGTMLYKLASSPGTLGQRLTYLTTPTTSWGPALPRHRMLVTSYVPGFVVDPSNDLAPPQTNQYYVNEGLAMDEIKPASSIVA